MMRVKEEPDKVGLKLNTQKTKIMASGPTTSWEIDGETSWNTHLQTWEATRNAEWRQEEEEEANLGLTAFWRCIFKDKK